MGLYYPTLRSILHVHFFFVNFTGRISHITFSTSFPPFPSLQLSLPSHSDGSFHPSAVPRRQQRSVTIFPTERACMVKLSIMRLTWGADHTQCGRQNALLETSPVSFIQDVGRWWVRQEEARSTFFLFVGRKFFFQSFSKRACTQVRRRVAACARLAY